MTSNPCGDLASTTRASGRFRRLILGCVIAPIVLLAVAAAAILIWWMQLSNRAHRDLAAEVAKVRERGEPLTTVELDHYYQPVAGRPDLTAEILAALARCNSADLKPLAEKLPIVGPGPPAEGPAMPGFGAIPAVEDEVVPIWKQWEQLEEAEAFLAPQKAALDTFVEVARRNATARYPVDLSLGGHVKLTHVDGLKNAARVLGLQFHVHLHRGRSHEAVDCILAQLGLSRTLDQHPFLVVQLARGGIDTYAIENISRALLQIEVSTTDLRRLQIALRKMSVELSPRPGVIGERAFSYSACVDPLVMLEGDGPTAEQAADVAKHAPQRVMDAAKSLELNRRFLEGAENSLSEAIQVGEAIDDEVLHFGDSKMDVACYVVTIHTAPAYRTAAEGFAKFAAMRDCADAAIAAELYRRKRGKWPETLEQLTPVFIRQVPTDPFDGKPLRIKITEGLLMVYSVGDNRQDDGGQLWWKSADGSDIGCQVHDFPVQE